MRRRSKELNIFSMSALDLFASAMGAFILITLILMPYYLNQTPQSTPAPTPDCPECPECPDAPECRDCPEPCVPCPEPEVVQVPVVQDRLILIQMFWDKKVDVDMHIKTPDGEFYYNKRAFDGRPGQFFQDNTKGGTSQKPAKEGWLSFKPTPGIYTVCYKYYKGSGSVRVWGKLQKPSGPVALKRVTLSHSGSDTGEKKCVMKFKVDNNFNVQILR